MSETTTNMLGEKLTVGVDLGDRRSECCVLGPDGEVLEESALPTTQAVVLSRRDYGRVARPSFEKLIKGGGVSLQTSCERTRCHNMEVDGTGPSPWHRRDPPRTLITALAQPVGQETNCRSIAMQRLLQ